MRLQQDSNFTTLSWIKPELDETLRQARQALEAHVEHGGDLAQMQECATHLHQVQGTLRMVELYGAAMVAEEMEQLANALLGTSVSNKDEAFGALMRSIMQLPDYLERLQSGHRDIPMVLLPLLNDLRGARGEKTVPESVLFSVDISRRLPASVGPAPAPRDLELLRASIMPLHASFQNALLPWLRDENRPETVPTLRDACARLLRIVSVEAARKLLWIASSLLEALESGAFTASKPLKQALAQLEREIKRLGEEGESAFAAAPPNDLIRQLLYHASTAPTDDPRVVAVREAFGLSREQLDESELAHARGSLTGHNRELLDTVSAGIKEDLLRVKEALDMHLRTQGAPVAELAPQAEALGAIADTLGMLGLGVPRKVVQDQRTAIQTIASGQRVADENALLEIAGSLLYVEASLDDQVARLGQPADEQANEGMPMPLRESQQALDALIKESVTNFVQARQCFVAFIEAGWDHAQLHDVPRLLDEVSGAMHLLEQSRAAKQLRALSVFTQIELVKLQRVPDAGQMDRLADALASLEYYLEALRDHRPQRDRILELAEHGLVALGYWPIPATAEQALAEAAKPSKPVAPVGAPKPVEAPKPMEAAVPAETMQATSEPAPVEVPVPKPAAEPQWVVPTPPEPEPALTVPVVAEVAPVTEPPAPAPVPIVPAVPSRNYGFADSAEIDDDIREVFIEELDEETTNLLGLFGQWTASPNDLEVLRPLRRVFHTLKGSGRLVGALELGEFSWKFESMLNRVLDGSRPASAAVVALVGQAAEILPQFRAALMGDNGAVVADIEALKTYAERVAGGEDVFYSPAAAVVAAPEPVLEVAPEPVAEPVAVAPEPVAEPEPVPVAAVPVEVQAPEEEAVPDGAAFATVDPILLEILRAEVGGHLQTIQKWSAASAIVAQPVSDALLRAVHTISGAFAMTEVPLITDALSPAEGYIRRLLVQREVPSVEGVVLVRDIARAIEVVLEALQHPRPLIPSQDELAERAIALRDALPEPTMAGIPTHDEMEEQQLEVERQAAEKAEADRLAAEHAEADRVAAEKVEAERLAAEQAEAERAAAEAAERAEIERQAAEQAEAERLAAEHAEAARVAAEEAEAERIAADQAEAARAAAELAEAERVAAEHAEAARAASEQAEAERLAAAQAEAEQAEAERLAAAQAEAEQAEAERLAAAQAEAEQAEAERIAAEQAEAARAAAELAESERLASEQAEAERVEAERMAAEQAESERLAAEQAEAERLAAEQAEAEHVAGEQAEAARLAAEKAEAEQTEAQRAEADRRAAEEEERQEYERLEAEYTARAEADRVAAEQSEAERSAAAEADADRLEFERLEAEYAARAEAERLASEAAEADRAITEHAQAGHSEVAGAELETVSAESETESNALEHTEAGHAPTQPIEAKLGDVAPDEAIAVAAEQAEAERAAAEHAAVSRAEAEQTEVERQAREEAEAAEQAEAERIAAEHAEAARTAADREAEQVAAELAEAERLEYERLEAEYAEADRQAAERAALDHAEPDHASAERADAQRAAEEQAEAERAAAERAEAERAEAERLAAEQAEAERVAEEQAEAERVASEQVEAERVAAEQAEAERVAMEQAEAGRLEAEQAEAERAAAEQAEAERLAAERAESERAAAEQAEAERVAVEKAEADRVAAERAEAERVAAEHAEAERLAAEHEAERLASEQDAERAATTALGAEVVQAARDAFIETPEAHAEAHPAATSRAHAYVFPTGSDPDPDEPLDMTDVDPELLEIFVEETTDILDHSDGLLTRLRSAPTERELVVGLQRDLHTLKGGARMCGMMSMGELAHAMESVLEGAADSRLDLSAQGLGILEQGFDRLHGMLSRIQGQQAVGLPENMIAVFNALSRGELPVQHVAPAAAAIEPSAKAAEPVEHAEYAKTDEAQEQLETAEAGEPSDTSAQPVRSKSGMKPLSAPVEAAFDPDDDIGVRAPQEQVRIRADLLDRLVNYAGEVAIYRARLEQQLGTFRTHLDELEQTTTRLRQQLRKLEIETEAQISARYQRADAEEKSFDPLELDRFSTQQQLTRALAESAADMTSLHVSLDDVTRQYETLLLQQSRVSSELQDGLMRTRMVPFDALVPRLRRVVRQAASETSKQIQLRVEGAQGEMDRNVLDRMTAPLEHMLRNSAVHGLETPEARRAAGKPEEGTVTVSVHREGSEVVMLVTDDGRGLDRDAIRRKAIDRGLLKPDVEIGDTALYGFILESGFSTADTVSRLAGRGVGMDVVHNEIRQLGGSLQLNSTAGKGTIFTIRLPFTLAVTQAALVKIGETSFAVPISSVQGVGRIARDELEKQLASAEPVFMYGGEAYDIHDLGRLLGQAAAKAPTSLQMPLLLSRSGDIRAAICVDEVLGSREIVVKPVGPQVSSIPGIFGATIMGDGGVMVILDVVPLVRRAAAARLEPEEPVVEAVPEVRRIPLVMVVDDSITMRKVTGRVLERNNMEVVAAKDGVDAIEKMAEIVPDVMLLDIEMPRMDGYELATHMRNDARLRDVPIIMITSRSGEKHRQRAFEIGVNRYLGKPYQEAELMRNVFELLAPVHQNG